MPKSIIGGAPLPPERAEPVYTVVAPAVGHTLDWCFLSERVLGYPVHWDREGGEGPRNRLCLLHEGECERCRRRLPLGWLGFAAVFDLRAKRRDVARFGDRSAAALARYVEQYAGLSGLCVNVRRCNDGPRSSLAYEPSQLSAPRPLPPPHCILATVRAVLGVAELPCYEHDPRDLVPLPPAEGEGGAV